MTPFPSKPLAVTPDPMRCTGDGARLALLCVVACLLGACGGEDGTGVGAGSPDPDGPLYAVSVRIPGTPVAAFVAIVDSLEAGTEVDLETALEIPNGGLAVGTEGTGVLYAVDGATPQLTRFEVSADGAFVPSDTLSTQEFSRSSNSAAAGNFVFISETKAYIIDTLSLVIVVWDPSLMEITGTIDLGEAQEDGLIALIGDQSVRRDNELVFALGYVSVGSAFGPDSKLVFVDTETDSIRRIVDVNDCAQASSVLLDPGGDVYAASGAANVFNRLAGLSAGAECIVRVPAGTYDIEDYALLSARTDGAPAGSLLPQSGTKAYTRVLDDSLIAAGASDIGDFNQSQAWRWGLVDLAGDEPFELITSLDPKSGSTIPFRIDGETWGSQGEPMFASSRLVNLSSDQPRLGLEATGVIINVFRVR
ncbi:MAG: hypothetical protein AAF436_11600 [Myxococcota bacterium]